MHIDDEGFDEGQWRKWVNSGHERYIEEDVDRDNKPIPLPHLHDEWLTKREIENRTLERKRRWIEGKEKVKTTPKVKFKENEEA